MKPQRISPATPFNGYSQGLVTTLRDRSRVVTLIPQVLYNTKSNRGKPKPEEVEISYLQYLAQCMVYRRQKYILKSGDIIVAKNGDVNDVRPANILVLRSMWNVLKAGAFQFSYDPDLMVTVDIDEDGLISYSEKLLNPRIFPKSTGDIVDASISVHQSAIL